MEKHPHSVTIRGFDRPFHRINEWLEANYGVHGDKWRAAVNHQTQTTHVYFVDEVDQGRFVVWGNLMGLFE